MVDKLAIKLRCLDFPCPVAHRSEILLCGCYRNGQLCVYIYSISGNFTALSVRVFILQEVHYVGGQGPLTLSMLAVPRRKRVFELWCGQSGRDAQLMVWYMGDMRYKRTLKHHGMKTRKTTTTTTNAEGPELRPWEVGVTLMAVEQQQQQQQQSRAHVDASSVYSTLPSMSTSVWTYVSPAGKVFRWDVPQKAQVGSMEVDSVDVHRGGSPTRRRAASAGGGEERGATAETEENSPSGTPSRFRRSSSSSLTSMVVMGGTLYLGRADGVVLVADAALDPGAAPLIAAFRPHDADIVSLLTIGLGAGCGRQNDGAGAGSDENSTAATTALKRTPSYRGAACSGGSGSSGVDSHSAMTKSTSGIGGAGGSSSSSNPASSSFNPPWWVSRQYGEGASCCPLLLSVGRGYRSLISSKCPTAAFSPAAVTHSSGANRNKTFVLSWYATEWDRLEAETE